MFSRYISRYNHILNQKVCLLDEKSCFTLVFTTNTDVNKPEMMNLSDLAAFLVLVTVLKHMLTI